VRGGGAAVRGTSPSSGEAVVIDGRAVAAGVRERVRAEVDELRAGDGVEPGLATVLVGDDPASELYVRRKRESCAEAGIRSFHHPLPADTSAPTLARTLADLNAGPSIHGILLQLPLPGRLDGDEMTRLIAPEKDVDGLHPVNAGLLAHGAPDAVAPCTPAGVMELLRSAGVELAGTRAVVIGRSTLVGRPMASLLLAADATVTQCHSRTRDLAAVCREADVLVAGAGVPGIVTADMVAEGATVIDVGTNRTEAGLVGDVDFDAVREVAGAITPVPGGVGPMTIAMLLDNTVRAARRALERG
jgi:methylenetetrahydrofolate dehydrogenase (NADP+)/methenyltetrahydrofolate cyclohydrolase